MSLTTFNFNGADVRTVTLPNGEPGFVGKDVASRLGYADPTTAIRAHCKGSVIRYPILTAGGVQEVRVLTTEDVAALVAGSTLPGAKDFAAALMEEMGVPCVVIRDARDEIKFGEEIVERLFSGYTIIRQFPVFGGKYRIDWYIPELRLAVEFDEEHHTTPANSAADAARQAEIESALNCRFLRYKAD